MTACTGPGSPLARLEDWYRTPLGLEVAARESACVEAMLADVFGYYVVQLGIPGRFREALAVARFRDRVVVPCEASATHPAPNAGARIVARPTQLPLASDAVDAVLLPHTLDFVPDPRQVLGEVERVLIPEGRVLVVGFNALSSWGLTAFLKGRRGRVPWCGRFRTAYRVEDWLADLGFDIERRQHIMFRPPMRQALGPRLRVMETLGRRLWPALGGVYAIRAVKRVSTLTPLKPAWGARRALLPGGAIEPTARGGLSNGHTLTGPGDPAARVAQGAGSGGDLG